MKPANQFFSSLKHYFFSSFIHSIIPFFLFFFFISFLFVVLISCNSNPTEPEQQPGRRDYVWTVDTLNIPMNVIGTIWGSSPQNVWTTGAGGVSEDRLLHYDGAKWITYKNEPIHCAGNTLFGFSANNIWMGGDNNGRIWHYDGTRWSENYRYIVEGSHNVGIYNIWGLQPNDVYACGIISYIVNGKDLWQSFVLHYNGLTWKEITKASFNNLFLRIRGEQNKAYIYSYSRSKVSTALDTISFYELNGNQLKKIYSNLNAEIAGGNIYTLNGKIYFLIGQDIYRYNDGNFVKQFSLTSTNFGYQFYGRNEKDIFLRMKDGLAHYNGVDIQYLFNWQLYMVSIINEPAIFEKEVFFCLWDAAHARNMVLHGKLKE